MKLVKIDALPNRTRALEERPIVNDYIFAPSTFLNTFSRPPPHLSTINSHKMAAPNVLNNIGRWAIPAAILFSLGQASIYDVKGGTRAVIFDRLSGVQDQVINEGTHFLIPWLQKSIIYDVRTKPRNISTTTGSKDLQMVSLTLRVLHRPEVQRLPKIYQVCPPPHPPVRIQTNTPRTSAKTTTSASSPQSATKSSNPSSRNSTPRSSSPNEKRSPTESAPTCSGARKNSISLSKTSASHT